MFEAIREHDDFGNKIVVWSSHGHRSKELLQIVWQLLSASVALTCRVKRDEYSRIGINVDLVQ
jgi:hypothetical protein